MPKFDSCQDVSRRKTHAPILVILCLGLVCRPSPLLARDYVGAIDDYLRAGKLDSALVAAQSFVSAYSDSPQAQGYLGMIYAETGQIGDARAAFRRSIELRPDLVDGYNGLALLYAKVGDRAKALEVLNEGIKQNPGSAALLLNRAVIYGSSGLQELAVDDLEEAIAHIQKFSSKHTDGIITENISNANKFMSEIDSAGVFHNCSTRFADGFRYGFTGQADSNVNIGIAVLLTCNCALALLSYSMLKSGYKIKS